MNKRTMRFAVLIFFGFGVVGITMAGLFTKDETPGERFRKAIEQIKRNCESRKLEPGEICGEVAKLKPADPLAMEEGRFAHSIKIPNPVPEDSGYRPGMTSEQYFDHLCKTEAGEFIYKTVENVEGIFMMRPGTSVPYGTNHLYALEDPYGNSAKNDQDIWFVRPSRYLFLETILLSPTEQERHTLARPDSKTKYIRYSGYDGKNRETMAKAFSTDLKSRYGYTWRGISRPSDRELGIAGGEVIVVDLHTQEVIGVHRGFSKFEIDEKKGVAGLRWARVCPLMPNIGGGVHLAFILKVVRPIGQSSLK